MWFDVGSPKELIRAQNVLIERRDELPFPLPQGVRIENGSFLHPDATISKNSLVQDSVIAQQAVVGENAVLKKCVLMNGSIVEQGAVVENCILSPGAVVLAKSTASGLILGDDEHFGNA